jgi:hypothetical protein
MTATAYARRRQRINRRRCARLALAIIIALVVITLWLT